MKFKIFSVFDVKAKAYLPPFFLPEEAMAVRTFKDCANDKAHAFGLHPEDYSLFRLGEFDSLSGELFPENECVYTALALVDNKLESGK